RHQLSRSQRAATATRAWVDRSAVALAPGPHGGGGAAGDLALLQAPERASDRSADRAGERVLATARCEARLHRRRPAARLAHRRRRVPRLGVYRPPAPGQKEPTMLIVDAQIHLWNAGKPTSPWHRQIPAYLKDDALKEMDAGGVDAAILTPHTPWDPNA